MLQTNGHASTISLNSSLCNENFFFITRTLRLEISKMCFTVPFFEKNIFRIEV